jgi:hypothetical protein
MGGYKLPDGVLGLLWMVLTDSWTGEGRRYCRSAAESLTDTNSN